MEHSICRNDFNGFQKIVCRTRACLSSVCSYARQPSNGKKLRRCRRASLSAHAGGTSGTCGIALRSDRMRPCVHKG